MRRDHLTAGAAGPDPRPRQRRRGPAARLRPKPQPHRGVSASSLHLALPGDPWDAESCPALHPGGRAYGGDLCRHSVRRDPQCDSRGSARGLLPALRRVQPLRLPLRADGAAELRRVALRAATPARCRQRVPRRDLVRGNDLQRAHGRGDGPGPEHRGDRKQPMAGPSDGVSPSDRWVRFRQQRQQVQQVHEPRRRAGGVVRARSSAARSAGRSRERISPRSQKSRRISRAAGSPGASSSRSRSPTMCGSCWRTDQQDPHPGARCSILPPCPRPSWPRSCSCPRPGRMLSPAPA